MQPAFTIGETLSFGWKKTIENFWFLALVTLGLFIVSYAFDRVPGDHLTVALFRILNLVVSYLAMFMFVKFGLKIYKGEKPTANDLLDVDWKLFGLYIIGSFITTALTGIGFVLLIIPGIYLSVRLSLFAFVLIDEKSEPIHALKRSMELSKGRFWQLLWVTVVIGCINILGVMAFAIGLLITVPLSLISLTYVYEKIKAAGTVAPAAPVVPVV